MHAELAIRWWVKKQQLSPVCAHNHPALHFRGTTGGSGGNLHTTATAQAQPPTHCTPHAQITAFHTQTGPKQSNRIQEHLGKNQTEKATTQDARHPQLPHVHITGWHLVALMRPQLQHKKEIRRHPVLAEKQNQHHGHLWAVPHGRQHVQCPQASRAKGSESGPPERTSADPKAEQTNLRAAADAPQLHVKFKDFPQTSNQQAQRPHHPIFHTLHATSVYKTPDHERHYSQLEGSTPQVAPRTPGSLHLQAVQGKIPRQPTRWIHRHRAVQSGTRRTMSGVLREIQRATRPENLGVAAPQSHTKMAPQQRPTRPKGRRNGDG